MLAFSWLLIDLSWDRRYERYRSFIIRTRAANRYARMRAARKGLKIKARGAICSHAYKYHPDFFTRPCRFSRDSYEAELHRYRSDRRCSRTLISPSSRLRVRCWLSLFSSSSNRPRVRCRLSVLTPPAFTPYSSRCTLWLRNMLQASQSALGKSPQSSKKAPFSPSCQHRPNQVRWTY